MTKAEKFKEVFGITADIDTIPFHCDFACPKAYDGCEDYCVAEDWWNDEYKEKRTSIGFNVKKAIENSRIQNMLTEIYMAGHNFTGEYQGCWIRFSDVEQIVLRCLTKKEETENDGEN